LLELREQPFSVAKVLDWADQLLDALEELHSSDPPNYKSKPAPSGAECEWKRLWTFRSWRI
jgi:hypothetical protein